MCSCRSFLDLIWPATIERAQGRRREDDRVGYAPSYCSSLTFSIQSADLPSSCSTMAMCVMAVVGPAPCQCFSPGGNQTTSPDRISSIGPPHRCARPHPAVTNRVCPSGCVCQAVRAPGSNVTLAPKTRAGGGAVKIGSTRTEPVKYSAGPFPEGCVPPRLISIVCEPLLFGFDLAADSLLEMRRIARAFHCDSGDSVMNIAKIVSA